MNICYLLKNIRCVIYILFELRFFICYSYFRIPCLFFIRRSGKSLDFSFLLSSIFSFLLLVRYYFETHSFIDKRK